MTRWTLDGARVISAALVFALLLLLPATARARPGLFLRLGLGPGIAVETAQIHGAGLALVSKEHQIGYGFTDDFALWVGEIGALIQQKVGTYDYVNVDGIVLGGTIFMPHDILVSPSAGYGRVAFAKEWTEPMGDNLDDGLAFGLSAKREWYLGSYFAVAAGVVSTYFQTFHDDYTYFTFSAVLLAAFYLTPLEDAG